MTANSMREGGCTTTPPPLPRPFTQSVGVLPVLAALSPVGATGLVWLAVTLRGPEVESLSGILRFSLVVVGAALTLSLVAMLRGRSRGQRLLSVIGLVGDLGLLAFILAQGVVR